MEPSLALLLRVLCRRSGWPRTTGESRHLRTLSQEASSVEARWSTCPRRAVCGSGYRLHAVQEQHEWIDAEAAARHLAPPATVIYRMIEDRQLPALRFPVRIRRSDLDECLERCRIRPGDLATFDPRSRRRRRGGEADE